MRSFLFSAPLFVALAATQSITWDEAYEKATSSLALLSQEEKAGIVTGVGWMEGPCVGNTYAPESIPYPSLCLQDGPLSVRFANPITVFPAGINAGATWDRELIRARGAAMGAESKGLGVHIQLGPTPGALGKIPAGGRNWEGFSNDPYLQGVATGETVQGMQGSGVQACAKHYILNEQELNRNTISSVADDRTMHELYLWPFYDAVKANVASVMCSYNKINGTWACENDAILNGLLKGQLGFRGHVLTDWGAQHSTVQAALDGLDMSMPGSDLNDPPGSIWWGDNLITAIANGSIPQARLDDMVTRILASWYLVGQDEGHPSVAFSSWDGGVASVNVTTPEHGDLARTIARDSIVLLKNVNGSLPLGAPASLAVIGSDAIVNPDGANACDDRGCNTGTLAQGWGSGTAEYPYLVAPLDAIQEKLSSANIVTSTTDDAAAGAEAASAAETAIVFITSDSGEGYITVEGHEGDRNDLDPWHDGNALVQAVAQTNTPTIVVVHSVGPVILETILAEPNVVAIVWAGLPGQESGHALTDVLFGDVSPSGKLPYTIGKSEADYGTAVIKDVLEDTFSEGLFIDYRHFDQSEIEPRYEFGFGLSYTTFGYSTLAASVATTSGPTTGETIVGGPSDLHASIGTVSVDITNAGDVAGAEVAQLYIGYPDSAPETPPKQLRGFEKLTLAPGESGVAEFELTRRDISYWDVALQKWVVPTGTFEVFVGASSRDVRLSGSFTV